MLNNKSSVQEWLCELENLSARNRFLEDENTCNRVTINQQEIWINDLKNKKAKLESKLENLEERYNAQFNRANESERNNKLITHENKRLRKEKRELKNRISQLETENQQLKESPKSSNTNSLKLKMVEKFINEDGSLKEAVPVTAIGDVIGKLARVTNQILEKLGIQDKVENPDYGDPHWKINPRYESLGYSKIMPIPKKSNMFYLTWTLKGALFILDKMNEENILNSHE